MIPIRLTALPRAGQALQFESKASIPHSGNKRKLKFGNKPVKAANGLEGFDSKHEQKVYSQLLWSQVASKAANTADTLQIDDIQRQIAFELVPAQRMGGVLGGKLLERAVSYVADFVILHSDGSRIVVDAKSAITRKDSTYIIKRKLMLFVHGIHVREM